MIISFNSLTELLITNAARPNDQILIANIPLYILLGQLDLTRKLNLLGTEKINQGELDPQISLVLKPSLWIRTVSLTIANPLTGQIIPLERRNYEYLNLYSPSQELEGEPKFYAEKDMNSLIVSPVPNVLEDNNKYSFELIYHELMEPLSETVQTNMLTQRYGDLLNYACTIQMYLALQSFSLVQAYQALYDNGIQMAVAQDSEGIMDRGQNVQKN